MSRRAPIATARSSMGIVVCVVALAACGSGSSSSTAGSNSSSGSGSAAKHLSVAFIPGATGVAFYNSLGAGVQA